MITLRKLSLKAFRSFQDETVVDLPQSGFVLIDGQNLDTGGSSGSGKTSIVEAVAFALGYAKLPATELQNRTTKEKLQVRLTIGTPQGDVEIARGKETYIKYLQDQRLIQGSKPVEEELRKLMGLPTDLIEALTYRPQRSFGRFISMTDSEKKEFLTNCLPELEEIERVADQARQEADRLDTKLQQENIRLNTLKEERDSLKKTDPLAFSGPVNLEPLESQLDSADKELLVLTALIQPARDAFRDLETAVATERTQAIAELERSVQGEFETIETQRLALQTLQTQQLIQLDTLRAAKVQIDKEAVAAANALRTEVNGHRSKLRELTSAYASKGDIERTVTRLSGEIATLESNVCPTCQRTWLEQTAKLQELQNQHAELQTKLVVLDAIRLKIAEIESVISALDTQIGNTPRDPRLDVNQAEQMAATKQVAEINAKIGALDVQKSQVRQNLEMQLRAKKAEIDLKLQGQSKDLAAREAHLNAKRQERDSLVNQIRAAEKSNADFQRYIENFQAGLEKFENSILATSSTIQELSDSLSLERSVHAALGRQGYLGSIFDEILAEISSEVSEVLALVPNVSTVSLQFSSEAETKKGTLKRSIVPVVTKDGVTASFASLSGGQQSSVELAVDLAIGNVIGRRTGRTPGWIVLDEAMDGLDLPAKESCMEILKRYAATRLIVMVDHSTELKEAFGQVINVVMKSGASVLRS